MRKLILLTITLIFVACTADELPSDADAVVDEAALANFEGDFLKVLGDHSFIYDVKINNDDIQEIVAYVDYYENGEFIERIADLSTYFSDSNADVSVAFVQQTFQETYEKWNVAIIDDSGSGALETENEHPKSRHDVLSTVWGSVGMPVNLTMGDAQVIAYVIYSDESTISSSSSIETEEDLQKLTNHEYVYVLSMDIK